MKKEITKRQLDAIRFYMGDPEIVESGIYQGGPKAYNTINALLHYGMDDEKEKIRDGKPIELIDDKHLKQYIELIRDIRKAMEIYRDQHLKDNDVKLRSYRIDRISAVERFRKDPRIYGYFSTCKWGFLPEYAHTKSDIVMLEVERDEDVPYLDFSELFREFYAKPEEAEILLPYGAVVTELKEIPLTPEECRLYYDMNGNPPRGKWRLHVSCDKSEAENGYGGENCDWPLTDKKIVEQISRCMRKLSEHRELSEAEEQFYCEWKRKLTDCFMGLR